MEARARRRHQPRLLHAATRCFWKTRCEPSIDGTEQRRTARSSPTRTRTSTDATGPGRVDRAPGATRASRPPPTASRRRTRSPASRSWSTPARRGITVPYAYRQLRMWRNTAAANAAPGQTLQLAPEHARLRVGRGRRQRLPPGGPVPALLDDRQRARGLHRLRQHRRERRHRHAQPDDVPRAERRARLRRRHRAVGLGPRRAEPVGNARGPQHAAGDREPVRRHGRAAVPAHRRARGGATASTDTTAPTSTITAPPATVADGAQVTITGTATDSGGGASPASRSRPTAARPGIRRPGTTSWTYTWIAHGNPSTTIRSRADRRQRQHRDARRRPHRRTCHLPLLDLWGPSVTPPVPTPATRRPSRSA